jgi:hypothetical protein
MIIEKNEKKFRKLKTALEFLEAAFKNSSEDIIVFRGHQESSWKLETTWSRFRFAHYDISMNEIMDIFKANLAKLGDLPFDDSDNLSWLEYGRHYGVPTPCIDFSYSPYIALFFAYNEISDKCKDTDYVAIYILNISQLAYSYKKILKTDEIENQSFEYSKFCYGNSKELLQKTFPGDKLFFISHPGKSNLRMQKQCGAFLYDTLNYEIRGVKNFDEFTNTLKTNIDFPILTKVYLKKEWAGEVFETLELMGISGTTLFMNAEGAAMDARNAIHYEPKTMFLRNSDYSIRFPVENVGI